MPLFSASEIDGPFSLAINPAEIELTELLQMIWSELSGAAGRLDHPWSHLTLATSNGTDVFQRVLILREVVANRFALMMHTDVRSPKVSQLQSRREASGCLYAPAARVQLSLNGRAFVHTDDAICEAQWQQTPPERYRNYLGVLPPGTPSTGPSSNLSTEFLESGLTTRLCEIARAQFAVIEFVIDEVDVLFLRPTGNLRAQFRCGFTSGSGEWVEP